MNFEIKGLPAIILVIVLAVGAIGYRMFLSNSASSDPELLSRLESHLISEIAGDQLADLKELRAAIDRGDNERAAELAEETMERSVQIISVATKGSGKNVIVKVEYTVYGPDKDETKTDYFKFKHSAITGWRYNRPTTAFSWHTKLF